MRAEQRFRPHRVKPDADAPGACRCGLIPANAIHSAERIAAYEAELGERQANARRRLGEED